MGDKTSPGNKLITGYALIFNKIYFVLALLFVKIPWLIGNKGSFRFLSQAPTYYLPNHLQIEASY